MCRNFIKLWISHFGLLVNLLLAISGFSAQAVSANTNYLPISWKLLAPADLNDARFSSVEPAIDPQGRIYIGIDVAAGGDSQLRAYQNNGTLLWQRSFVGSYQVHRIIAMPGYLLVSTNNTLYKLSYDGATIWQYSGVNARKLVIGPDDAIYTQRTDSKLMALNPNGSVRWLYNLSNGYVKDLILNQSGQLVLSMSDRRLLALSQEGQLLWSLATADRQTPDDGGLLSVSSRNEVLYNNASDGKVMAIKDDGTLAWQYQSDQSIPVMRALVAPDGRIVVHSYGQGNLILSADGNLEQTNSSFSQWNVEQLITNAGTLVSGNRIQQLSSGIATQYYPNAVDGPLSLTPNGTLLFTVNNRKELVAINIGASLPQTGWPKAGLNIANNPSKAPPAKPFYRELAVDIDISGAVAVDGENVYAATRFGSLIKYSKTGVVIWQRNHANREGLLAPLTAYNTINLVVQSGHTGQVLNYNASGQLRWSHDIDSAPASAVLAQDSLLYIGTSTGWLYAFSPDGNQVWQKKITSGISNSISAMLHDGEHLLLTDSLGGLYQINSEGTVVRHQQFDSKILFSPVVTHAQQLVLAFADEIVLLTKEWQFNWRWGLSTAVVAQPTLTASGDIIIQQADATVSKRALTNGAPVWQYQMSANSVHAAVHTLDGSLYVAAQDWTLYQLSAENGSFQKRINLAEEPRSAPAVKTRVTEGSHPELLLIATADQKLKWIEIADARLALSQWPKAGQGLGNRSSLQHEGALSTSIAFKAAVSTKVLHKDDGSWFVASEDGIVSAMDNTNQLRWSFDTDGYLTAAMALSGNGRLFVANTTGKLVALSDAGQPIWQVSLGQGVTTGIALDTNNNLYLGTEAGIVRSLDGNGQQRWQINLGSALNSVPVIEQDWGSVFVISRTGVLKRLSLDNGEILYEKQGCEPVLGSLLSVTDDGFISVQCADYTVFYDFALNVRSQFSRSDISLTSVPLISTEPTEKDYLFTDLSGVVSSISFDQQEWWRVQLIDPVGASSLVDTGNSIIYIATFEGDVVALSFSGQLLWSQSLGSRVRAPLTMINDKLVVAADNGRVYFIKVKMPLTQVTQAGADQRNSQNIKSLQNGVLLFDDGYDNQVLLESALSSASYNSFGHKVVNFNGGIRSFELNGALRWTFVTDNAHSVNAGITINSNDINLFGDNGGKLYAVSPLGQLVWKTQLPAPIKHGVTIISAELAAVTYGTSNGKVVIFNMLTGQALYHLDGDGQAVALRHGGVLVTQGVSLRKYTATGQSEWQTRFDHIDFGINYLSVFAVGTPVPADNGDIFIDIVLDNSTGSNPVLYTVVLRLNAAGEYISHSEPLLDSSSSQLAYDAKRQALFIPLPYSAANIDVAQPVVGATQLIDLTVGPILAAPLLDDSGNVYLSGSDGDVAAYGADGQVVWHHKLPKRMVANSFSLTPNGFLAIGPYYLKASASGESVSLAEGWPKYAGTAANANYMNIPYQQPEIALDIAANLNVQVTRNSSAYGDVVYFSFSVDEGYSLSRKVVTSCGNGYWQSAYVYVLSSVTTNCSIAFFSQPKLKRKRLPVWLFSEQENN